MRGKVVADDQPVDARSVAKAALLEYAYGMFELSWSVGKFSSRDRWALKWYSVGGKEDMPGALVVTDRDTEIDVMVYAQAGVDWHGVQLEFYWEGEWHPFLPQKALAEWMAGSPIWAGAQGMPAEVNW